MYLTTRRALDPLQNLRRLNSVLDEAFHGWPFDGSEGASALTAAWVPACDVTEDDSAVKIVAELPGMKPDDVKIAIENNVLTIRGEKKQEVERKTERLHRYERSYGAFERTFVLPSTVDSDRIDATYADGLLTLVVPKAEKARPREIAVKVHRPNEVTAGQ